MTPKNNPNNNKNLFENIKAFDVCSTKMLTPKDYTMSSRSLLPSGRNTKKPTLNTGLDTFESNEVVGMNYSK